jgi:hypothetical protein
MKPSPSKTAKTTGKKRGRDEAAGSAAGAAPPMSPPRPDPNREWKKLKTKTEDLLALLDSGFIREKEKDLSPGLELRPRTAALCRHLRFLLPARAYV